MYDFSLDNKIENRIDSTNNYKKFTKRKKIVNLVLIFLILVLSIVSISAGSSNLSFKEVVASIFRYGSDVSNVVIWRIRLPRVLGAIVAGAGLSVAGCVMQNNLRNPLASPSTLGISNAAAFGANLAIIVLGAGTTQSSSSDAVIINNPYMVTVFAFIWAMVSAFIVILLAKLRGFRPEIIVLAGVAIGSLFSAGTILIQYFAEDTKVAAAVFWTFGDLGRISYREICIMSFIIFLAIIYFMYRRWDYNAFDSGEESAKSLGVNVDRVRFEGMFVASLITAVSVSFLGIIGFVGLIGPQMMRRIIGGDHRFLIPSSALMGSLILLASDTLARTVIAPIVLPVGVITSFLGAPLFLYLLIRGYKN
ncbi:iron ABC transporter permease [Clostridium botulinum]|nr:iron ABC transporter permease [Clostridium botulinum]